VSEEKLQGLVRDFLEVFFKPDVEGAMALLTDDVVWSAPQGTFRGKNEVKRYIQWLADTNVDASYEVVGMGIMASGNTAVVEHDLTATFDGKRWKTPGVCIYEFEDDKITQVRTLMDRLAIADQAAKGFFAPMFVRMVVKGTEKGLR